MTLPPVTPLHHLTHQLRTEESLRGLHYSWRGSGYSRSGFATSLLNGNGAIYRVRLGPLWRSVRSSSPRNRRSRHRGEHPAGIAPRLPLVPLAPPRPAPPPRPHPSSRPSRLPSGSRCVGLSAVAPKRGSLGAAPAPRASPRVLGADEAHGARSSRPCRVRPFLDFSLQRVSVFLLRLWGWARPGRSAALWEA